jgi:hypothetical protein
MCKDNRACRTLNRDSIWMLDVSVQQRHTNRMGVRCAVFATIVVSKVVRDMEEPAHG